MSVDWDEIEGRNALPLSRIIVIALVVVLALVAWMRFAGDVRAPPVSPVATQLPQEPTAERETLPSTVVTPPSILSRGPVTGRQSVLAYECVVNGQRVVSDHACGPDARERAIEFDPVTAPPPPVPVYRSTGPSGSIPSYSAGSSAAAVGNDAACATVDSAIAGLNAQMRQGYTSQQGEWYRARWHALQDQRQALRCGR